MKVDYNIIRSLVLYEIDYTIPQALYIIEQYILARTSKKVVIVVNQFTNIIKFESAITTAHNYFKMTHGKLWH